MFKLLHATQSVLSGPAVLLAIMPWSFEPRHLEIYVPKSQEAFTTRTLRDIFGFKGDKTIGPYDDGHPIYRIVFLEKDGAHIKVISSSTENALYPIFHSYSTLLMNFISSVGIACAYPDLTLKRRGLINSSVFGYEEYRETVERRMEMFHHRGFALSTTLRGIGHNQDHICTRDPSCPHTIRSLYDSGTLFHKFEREGTAVEMSPLWVHNSTYTPIWCFGNNACDNRNPSVGWIATSSDAIVSVSPQAQYHIPVCINEYRYES